jgi:hypothetical protein
VQALGTLQGVRWVASSAEPRFGLETPELRVRFEIKNPPGVHELAVGATTSGGHFARLAPDSAVFVLSEQVFEVLSQPFIDRALCPEESEQTSISVKSAKGEGVLSQVRMSFPQYPDGLKEALRSLKAEFAVHLGAAKPNEGLSHPALELVYSAGRQVKVVIGNCDTLRDQSICYARRSDVNATFALSSRVVSVLRSATRHEIP